MSVRALAAVGLALGLGTIGCGRDASSEEARGPRVRAVDAPRPISGTRPIRVRFAAEVGPEVRRGAQPLSEVALVFPPLEAQARFEDAETLLIEPAAPYRPATRYRFALRPGILGATGALEGDRSFSVQTPPFSLELSRAYGTERGAEVVLWLSHPVDPARVDAAFSARDDDDLPLEHRVLEARGARVRLSVESRQRLDAVQIVLDAGLSSSAGGEPLGKSVRRRLRVHDEAPLVERARPLQRVGEAVIGFDLARSLPPSDIAAALSGDSEWALSSTGFWLLGPFPEDGPLVAEIGPPLASPPETLSLARPPLEPGVRFTDPRPLLGVGLGESLRISSEGVQTLSLSSHSLQGSELGQLSVAAHPSGVTAVDVGGLLGATGGPVELRVADAERPWVFDARGLGRRGFELLAHARPGYAWVQVLAGASPGAGARVRVLAASGEVLDATSADGNGRAELRWSGEASALFADEPEGVRQAYLPMEEARAWSGARPSSSWAAMTVDRAVAAPGQSVAVSIVLADDQGRPEAAKLDLVLVGADETAALRASAQVGSTGLGSATLELPPSVRPGPYRIELRDRSGVLAEQRLAVRARRGARHRVELRQRPGEPVFGVRVFGRAEQLAARCLYTPLLEHGGLPRLEPSPAPFGPVELGVTKADVEVRCPQPPPAARPWRVELLVSSEDGAWATASSVVGDRDRYLAFVPGPRGAQAGEPLEVEVRAVALDGRPVTGDLAIRVSTLEVSTVRRVTGDGRLLPGRVAIPSEGTSLSVRLDEGRGRVPFVPGTGGGLRLSADATSLDVWVESAEAPPPARLELAREPDGVRVALPFPGTLLLTEEAMSVDQAHLARPSGTVFRRPVGLGAVSAVLVGAGGAWSSAWIPPAPDHPSPRGLPVELTVPDGIAPGEPIDVAVRVRGPAWGGAFRVLAVDASAAPSRGMLERGLGSPERWSRALDTLLGPAMDATAPRAERVGSPSTELGGRPGRTAVSSGWVTLSSSGLGYARLYWPRTSGRARFMVLARAGGRVGVDSVDRIVGDGLGLDVALPSAVRAGDRVAVPVLLENGSRSPVDVEIAVSGTGFASTDGGKRARVGAGEGLEVRLPVLAREEGDFVLDAGSARVSRAVPRWSGSVMRWRGRGASAGYKSPAVLPVPSELGAERARLVVAPPPTGRHLAALAGLLAEPVVDDEQAAAVVLAAVTLPSLVAALDGKEAVERAEARLAAAMASSDPWVRALAAHARIASRGFDDVARSGLMELASGSKPAARAYARWLLARAGKTPPPAPDEGPHRLDIETLDGVAEVLAGRAERASLDALAVTPHALPRSGRFSSALVDALALLALASAGVDDARVGALESALMSAASDGRFGHGTAASLALVALNARTPRAPRPYWGSIAIDGATVKRFSSQRPTVVELEALGGRPEVSVTGAGTAEVSLVFTRRTDALDAAPLTVEVEQTDASGAPMTGPLLEGRPFSLSARVRSSAAEEERILVRVPIPAGATVEGGSTGMRTGPTYCEWDLRLAPGEEWSGRVDLSARFAGVWQRPAPTARLRYALSEARGRRGELRIDYE